MKDSEFKKGIEGLRQIRLGSKEKDSILKSVFSAGQAPASGMVLQRPRSWIAANQRLVSNFWASLFVTATLVSILMYNAESSLPGDFLYPIKVSFTEPLRDFFSFTPENRAQWESTKAVRRLDEAANLAVKGKLDEKNRTNIENLFNEHVDSYNASIAQAASSTIEASLIKTEFEENVSARVKVLASLSNDLEEKDRQNGSLGGSLGDESGMTGLGTTTLSTTTATTTSTTTASTTATSTSKKPFATSTASSTASTTGSLATGTATTTSSSTVKSGGFSKDREEQTKIELKKLEDSIHKKLKETKNLPD